MILYLNCVILFMKKMQQIKSSLILLMELIFIEVRKKLKQNLRFHKEQLIHHYPRLLINLV